MPLVVGQARGHINRDDDGAHQDRVFIELLNGLREVPCEGPLTADANDAVDPHFRECHQGELGGVKNCGD